MNFTNVSSATTGVEGYLDQIHEFPAVQDVIRSIECPICLEVPIPPVRIFQCRKGHIVCGNCRHKDSRGCTCRSSWTNKRNFALEDIICSSLFKCTYEKEGCGQLVKGEGLAEHVKTCKYRPLVCNIKAHRPCTNKLVPMSKFLEHVKEVHFVVGQIHSVEDGNKFEFQINPHSFVGGKQKAMRISFGSKGVNRLQLIFMIFDGEQFLIHCFITTNENLCMWVISLEDTNDDYQISVLFSKGELNYLNKQITHLLPVHPLRTDIKTVMQTFGYADMSRWQMKMFLIKEKNILRLPFVCTVEKNTISDCPL